jgi:hypothetical protein
MILTRLALVVVACAPLAAFACGGNEQASGVADAKLPAGASRNLGHEDCSESGNKVELLDTNNDGKPDIRRVFDKRSGHELCRVVDLNHDGKPDLYEYYDASGTLRRREYCYDDTGVVNAVEVYQQGKLSQREYDTAGQHKIDTWDWFDTSAPVDAKTGRPAHPIRRERDTTGSGHVDQWWTWNGDQVSIAVDSNGDGKPDPASTLVLGKDGTPVQTDDNGVPLPPPAASSSAPAAASAAPASSGGTGDSGAASAPVATGDGGKP